MKVWTFSLNRKIYVVRGNSSLIQNLREQMPHVRFRAVDIVDVSQSEEYQYILSEYTNRHERAAAGESLRSVEDLTEKEKGLPIEGVIKNLMTANALKKDKIKTLEDLLSANERRIRGIKGVSADRYRLLRKNLLDHGFRLRQ